MLAAAPQPPEAVQSNSAEFDGIKTKAATAQLPVELLERIQESLGSFVSDQGWSQSDMDTADALDGLLAAAPQPPEAAPVELPEPAAFALEWTFNGEERGMRLYDDETHCRFDAESDGGVCQPLYTEQQVRELLAAHGIGKDKA